MQNCSKHKMKKTLLGLHFVFLLWGAILNTSYSVVLDIKKKHFLYKKNISWSKNDFYAPPPPPLKKEGHIALHMSVGMSVGMSVFLYLVQLITQEYFAPETSNLVGR